MKILLKAYIVFSILLLLPFKGIAQYIPLYELESLTNTEINDDIIFPFVFNGYLYSFALNHKILVWRIFIGGDLVNPFLVKGDFVYFYDIYNRVYSVDIYKKSVKWKIDIDNEIKGNPQLYNQYLIISTLKGTIYVINTESGKIILKFKGEDEINAGLIQYKNYIIIPYKNGKLALYDIDLEIEKWVFNAGGIISVAPVIRNDCLYFGAWDDTFYALNIETGKPCWICYVGENITRNFLVFDNEIILFFSNGETISLSTKDGSIKWVKYFKNLEFNYNYFSGNNKFFIFIPDFIAINPDDGDIIFNYRERAFNLYKDMLFDNMIEGQNPLSEKDRIRMLSDIYFNVDEYPILPPVKINNSFVYFITDDLYLYIYDLNKDFFIGKYKIS